MVLALVGKRMVAPLELPSALLGSLRWFQVPAERVPHASLAILPNQGPVQLLQFPIFSSPVECLLATHDQKRVT